MLRLENMSIREKAEEEPWVQYDSQCAFNLEYVSDRVYRFRYLENWSG